MENVNDSEKLFLLKQLKEAQNRITKLEIMLKDVGADPNSDHISDEEAIAVQQIALLKQLSDERQLSGEEVKNYDILHKNLKLAKKDRESTKRQDPTDALSDEDLINLVKIN